MREWIYHPEPTDVPQELKLEIEAKARNLINSELKKKHIKGKKPHQDFNYRDLR